MKKHATTEEVNLIALPSNKLVTEAKPVAPCELTEIAGV